MYIDAYITELLRYKKVQKIFMEILIAKGKGQPCRNLKIEKHWVTLLKARHF